MQSFRLPLAYTDAELAAYERLILYRFGRHAGPPVTIGLIAAAMAVALAAGLVCVAAHIATPHDARLVVILVFAAFWTGRWSPTLLGKRRTRRQRRAYHAAWQARMEGAVVIAATDIIVLRTPSVRAIYKRSAIPRTGIESGLLLLWTGPQSAVAIPLRLLTPEQRDWLLSFHAGVRPAQATPASDPS